MEVEGTIKQVIAGNTGASVDVKCVSGDKSLMLEPRLGKLCPRVPFVTLFAEHFEAGVSKVIGAFVLHAKRGY